MTDTYKPRFLTGDASSPLRVFNSIMMRIAEPNYNALIDKALKLEVLENISIVDISERCQTKDTEMMFPIGNAIIKGIRRCNEKDPQIDIYSNLFIDMTNKWSGCQGRVLMRTVNTELGTLISEYASEIGADKGAALENSLKMYSVMKFLCNIYSKGKIPSLYIMKVMESFCKDDEVNFSIFIRLLSNSIDTLKNDAFFKAKLEKKYRTFITAVLEKRCTGANRFTVQCVLAKW